MFKSKKPIYVYKVQKHENKCVLQTKNWNKTPSCSFFSIKDVNKLKFCGINLLAIKRISFLTMKGRLKQGFSLQKMFQNQFYVKDVKTIVSTNLKGINHDDC